MILICKLLLSETEPGIFKQILLGKLDFQSEPWPSISDSAKDLIRKMLDQNPKTRLTAHEVLRKLLKLLVEQITLLSLQRYYINSENVLRAVRCLSVSGHPWIVDDSIAPDKPLDSAVLSRLKQFSAMNKLKKMALRVRLL